MTAFNLPNNVAFKSTFPIEVTVIPRYREDKTVQAAARFLQHAGRAMNYMKLIKLLYIMDRTALSRWGHPVTYDRYVSMPHGPVLSFTLDRINEGDEPDCPGYWSKFISPPSAYKVSLIEDPQDDDLSEAETGLIDDIYSEYGDRDQWQLRDHCHENFSEWKNPEGSSLAIHYRDILEAVGKTEAETKEIIGELESFSAAEQILIPNGDA